MRESTMETLDRDCKEKMRFSAINFSCLAPLAGPFGAQRRQAEKGERWGPGLKGRISQGRAETEHGASAIDPAPRPKRLRRAAPPLRLRFRFRRGMGIAPGGSF